MTFSWRRSLIRVLSCIDPSHNCLTYRSCSDNNDYLCHFALYSMRFWLCCLFRVSRGIEDAKETRGLLRRESRGLTLACLVQPALAADATRELRGVAGALHLKAGNCALNLG